MKGGPLHGALALLRPHRTSLVVALGLGVAATGASLSQPVVIGSLIGGMSGGPFPTTTLLLLVALFVVEGAVAAAQALIVGRTGSRIVLGVRETIVHRLLRGRMSDHQERRRGDTMARMLSDTSLISGALTQSLAGMLLAAVTVIGAVALMVIIDPVLAGVTALCLLVAAVAGLTLARWVRRATVDLQGRVGDFGAAVERALAGLSTIKISRAEDREAARLTAHAGDAYRAQQRVVRLVAALLPAVNLGLQASYAVVFVVGALRLSSGALSLGTFTAFLLYLFYMVTPLVNFFASAAQFQQGVASVARLQEIMTLPAEEERPGAVAPVAPRPEGEILRLDDVWFAYQPGRHVLRGVSFSVPARGVTAIVGPSGAGKSTIFSLIERLWEADDGAIMLGGRNVRDIDLAELRARVGYVEQHAPVMDGTIRENLLYAAPDATEAELEHAIEAANLNRWIDGLEDGLDGQVGEEGAELSGGQRQRVAIGRMILTRPDVLLMDEVTAHLDAESEQALRDSIKVQAAERAVVVIAHRLSTVVDADKIIVVEDGRVRGEGTHDSLMASDDLYRRLVHTQFAPELTEGKVRR
ncbi:ABC transporter ATP-binding protein [Nonomuraea sp. NPDC050786]|uniref:ABC transporter ATP-binding protein n=1 Tax=Nonomuraea sp. NPDC050786 TaxID=3154840 RepID=UPI0033DEBE75